ncbi:uncharacterized protein PHACADRAFT_265467 [Phanerochaete carnosa HHB-10118-sp]|uniref:DUF676 domain-containing protein n=1 Tax=Phanerochaete carnosa (strain HHB-10118-sp) TaxID=650164 RepID=K5VF57_PHACS|nr:uncharacterized protein PHACADRAFT_265467 [Phanerochaete carnosa HHB-10118-sp]EKM49783.1 hypothetical protein PHACADRAFT_265467 [Phanerochaete carnosa HHB-10118-sp]
MDGGMSTTDSEPQRRPPPRPKPVNRPLDAIHRLMCSPALYDPVRAPRHPIALCHGLYGFDVRGPSSFPILRQEYWSNVLNVLRQRIGAEVIVTAVPATGSVTSRAKTLHDLLKERAPGRSINFMAHSMGGLDCRHLISHIKPTEYTPVSLTTVATPHRGSPFMDWCTDNIGIGKLRQKERELNALRNGMLGYPELTPEKDNEGSSKSTISLASLPSSFTTLLLSLLDSPAYANLSTTYLREVFNPHTPDDPKVRYFSVAGRLSSMNIWHPLWLPKMVLDGYEERERERLGGQWGNDGLVTVQSAKWGEFLGILEEVDHWELRGARGFELGVDLPWGSKGSEYSGVGDEREGWGLGDWGRLVRAWKKEEKKARDAGAAVSEREESGRARGTDEGRAKALNQSAKEKEQGFVDEVVKASTEKVSAIFDWIVEQVPSRNSGHAPQPQSLSAALEAKEAEEAKAQKASAKSDLATKADLERFYVALCRKLYDEGL